MCEAATKAAEISSNRKVYSLGELLTMKPTLVFDAIGQLSVVDMHTLYMSIRGRPTWEGGSTFDDVGKWFDPVWLDKIFTELVQWVQGNSLTGSPHSPYSILARGRHATEGDRDITFTRFIQDNEQNPIPGRFSDLSYCHCRTKVSYRQDFPTDKTPFKRARKYSAFNHVFVSEFFWGCGNIYGEAADRCNWHQKDATICTQDPRKPIIRLKPSMTRTATGERIGDGIFVENLVLEGTKLDQISMQPSDFVANYGNIFL